MHGQKSSNSSSNKLKQSKKTCAEKISKSKNLFDDLSGGDSKEAARHRRNRENDEFKYLASLLPLQIEITQQLDKASIIRLTINYLRLKILLDECSLSSFEPKSLLSVEKASTFESNHWIHSCLNGFVFILSYEGRFLYVSESVSALLGLSQYLHEDDQVELSQLINMHNSTSRISMTARFRSTLLRKNPQIRYSKWRLMQIVGQAKRVRDTNDEITGGFIGIALSIDSQYFSEVPIHGETLVFKLSSDFVIESFENVSSYSVDSDMIGKSLFHLCHPMDLDCTLMSLDELRRKEYVTFFHRIILNEWESVLCSCTGFIVSKPIKISADELSSGKLEIGSLPPLLKEHHQIILVNEIYKERNYSGYYD